MCCNCVSILLWASHCARNWKGHLVESKVCLSPGRLISGEDEDHCETQGEGVEKWRWTGLLNNGPSLGVYNVHKRWKMHFVECTLTAHLCRPSICGTLRKVKAKCTREKEASIEYYSRGVDTGWCAAGAGG